jgi:N-acyl-D-amino-acid deacylase
MQNLIINNALILDGSGSPPFQGVVCIKNNKIKHISKTTPPTFESKRVIDADGMMLTPGFIDPHGHSDISILAAPEATGKISQGITTEVCGNCGLSVFPITGNNREHLQELFNHYNVDISWSTFAEYAKCVEDAGPAINIASLCGHNTLRAAVSGYEKKQLTSCELRRMEKLHSESIEQGASGTSTGLLYVPGQFANFAELTVLGKTVANSAEIFTSHLRSEGKKLLEAIDEFIAIAEKTGIKHIHISHFKTAGKSNWHKLEDALLRISQAKERGIHITADRYPYIESMTQLSAYMPSPYSEMDDIKLKDHLSNSANFAEFIESVNNEFSENEWSGKRVVSTGSPLIPPALFGQTFDKISANLAITPAEICAELLRDDAPGTMGASMGMSESNMIKILTQPFVCCATDESARPADYSIGRSHPRGFGSFPQFIKLLLPYLPIEEIIRKMTSLPAQIFNIRKRGMIKEGYFADLVLLDPAKIADSEFANFADPHKLAPGIKKVWVNGELAYCNTSKIDKRSGIFLKF